MIFIPIKSDYAIQKMYSVWCCEHVDVASVATWFWAGHLQSDSEDFRSVKDAIVFVDHQDAAAFRLKFNS